MILLNLFPNYHYHLNTLSSIGITARFRKDSSRESSRIGVFRQHHGRKAYPQETENWRPNRLRSPDEYRHRKKLAVRKESEQRF